jgi:DNA-binding response OmpR family regulator
MRRSKILVVEDEASIRKVVRTYLESAGHLVTCVDNGADALAHNRSFQPDLIVLDLNLSGIDGMEVAARIREESDVYIMMLTARTEEEDRVSGLRIGADDYLTKPFSPREMVARVEAILRRARGTPGRSSTLHFQHLSVDPDSHEAAAEGVPLDLTLTEFQVLHVLAQNAGRVMTRDQLIEKVWGPEFFGNDRVVDVFVGQVRRKLLEVTETPLIETVRGVGYKFVDSVKS